MTVRITEPLEPGGRKRMHMTRAEFLALPEYSCSYPTGTKTGKRWRRHDGSHDPDADLPPDHTDHVKARWFILEYGDLIEYPDDHPEIRHWKSRPESQRGERPGLIAILWYDLVISVRADT